MQDGVRVIPGHVSRFNGAVLLDDELEKARATALSRDEKDGLDSIERHLALAAQRRGIVASRQGWRETLKVDVSDGSAITAAAEALMTSDYTIPAGVCSAGSVFTYTLMGRLSSAITTPGTFTFSLRWGGVAGTLIASSGAFAPDPTAAATNLTVSVDWYVICRTPGATGTGIGFGRIWWSDFDDATVTTITGNLNMMMAPTSAPATFTMDTTTGKALSPTYTPSLGTASYTNHFALLESVN